MGVCECECVCVCVCVCVWAEGGIESPTQDSRCNLWPKNVDTFCFDAFGSLFFNCNGRKADPIE